ncbi:hypothetical protein BFJ68_g15908 [Fusarium oxysporum]|uniref:Uncharacterized protein n=1 Tax=Fusarium oxysporum TaxID=5507 RepID=A0A420PIU9_FUSOX|nr:hypothetical protein BFJ68_g15908 [Fusarium oxysporum]
MADPMGAEIVVEQDAAKTPESGGEAYEQGPRHGATIGRYCHRNATKHPTDDAKRTGRRTDRPTDRNPKK